MWRCGAASAISLSPPRCQTRRFRPSFMHTHIMQTSDFTAVPESPVSSKPERSVMNRYFFHIHLILILTNPPLLTLDHLKLLHGWCEFKPITRGHWLVCSLCDYCLLAWHMCTICLFVFCSLLFQHYFLICSLAVLIPAAVPPEFSPGGLIVIISIGRGWAGINLLILYSHL